MSNAQRPEPKSNPRKLQRLKTLPNIKYVPSISGFMTYLAKEKKNVSHVNVEHKP